MGPSVTKEPAAREAKHSGKISKPAVLKPGHDVASFDCERDLINTWLRTRAKKAGESDTARTFVVCRGKRVVGFYALAAGAVDRDGAPGALRRNTPDPIPVIILAMFGVHKEEKGQGIGQDLLNDAMRRALQAARIIGARALLVHALDAEAARYYKAHNFAPLDAKEETFFITMKEIRDGLS
jgi:GNAT superfamily N-acetyltransferase